MRACTSASMPAVTVWCNTMTSHTVSHTVPMKDRPCQDTTHGTTTRSDLMRISNKKHFIDHIITGRNIPDNPTSLPYLTRKQMHNLIHRLMWHRCMDVCNEFRNGNRVYIVDSDTDQEGLLIDDVQRIRFQELANEISNKFINME